MIPLEMGIVVLSVILAPPPANSAPGLSFRLLVIYWWNLLVPPAFTIRPIDSFPTTGIITPRYRPVERMDRDPFLGVSVKVNLNSSLVDLVLS